MAREGEFPVPHVPTPLRQRLTEREKEVVALLLQGYSNREIAARCFISEQTVKDHLKHIYTKTGIHHRSALMAWLWGTNHRC